MDVDDDSTETLHRVTTQSEQQKYSFFKENQYVFNAFFP